MSKFTEVTSKPGRALIGIYDPGNAAKSFDAKILGGIFAEHHLGTHKIEQVEVNGNLTATFIVDFDAESLKAAQEAAEKNAGKLTAANLQTIGGPQGKASPEGAESTEVNPDQSHDVQASMSALALDPFTSKEADLAAAIDVRDVVAGILLNISNKAIKIHESANDANKKGKEPALKEYEYLVYRFEKKIQERAARVYAEIKQQITTASHPAGYFNVIQFQEISAESKSILEKYGIPAELDI